LSEENSAVETATEGTAATTAATTGKQTTTATTTAETGKTAGTATTGKPSASTVVAAKETDTLAPPSEWPSDWRAKIAGEDADALKALDKYTDVGSLWKKVQDQAKYISASRKTPTPPKADASPEEVAEYRKAIGVPDAPEKYFPEGKLFDGRLIGEADKPIVDEYAKFAHAAGYKPEDVQRNVGFFLDLQEKQVAAMRDADQKANVEAQVLLRSDNEWGPDFNRNIGAIGTLFSRNPNIRKYEEMTPESQGLMDLVLGARLGNGNLFGNDPTALKALAEWATELYPSATWMPNGGGSSATSIESRLKEIADFARKDRAAYYRDEGMQAEERRLIDIQSRTSSKAA
jgi:hypothetical protein